MDFVSTCMEVVMANKYDYSLYICPKVELGLNEA